MVSIVVACIALVLGFYAYRRWQETGFILGEVLVLSGALSNLIDRVVYAGVIDFIALSWAIGIFLYLI